MNRLIRLAVAAMFAVTALRAATPPRSMSLAACIRTALERSPDVAAAHSLVDSARAGVKISHAGYLPQLDVGMAYTRQSYNYWAEPGTPPFLWRQFYRGESATSAPYYYGGLNLAQTIFDFGRTKGAVEMSQAQLQAAEHNLLFVRDQVAYNVRTAYYTVIAAQKAVGIQQATLGNAKKHLDQSLAFHRNGTVPGINVTSGQLAVANAQLALRQTRETLKVDRAELATAMGIPVDQAPEPLGTLPSPGPEPAFNQLLQEADQNRADLLAQFDQVKAALGNELAARGAMRPDISLGAFLSFRNLTWPLIYNWSLGQALAQSLFSGGANTAHLRQAQAQQAAAQHDVDSLKLEVQQQVYAALSNLKVARDQIATAMVADRFARQNLALAEGRYSVGVGNIVELNDAQTQATSAALQLLAARYNYQVAKARLDFVLGRGPK